MPTAKDYNPAKKIIAAFVGESKSGKSAAAASFPDFFQFDFDGRFDGIWGALKCNGGFLDIDPEKIEYKRMLTRQGYFPLQRELTDIENAVIAYGKTPKATYDFASAGTLVQALLNSSHQLQKGKMIGNLRVSGPGDFNFEVSGLKQILDFVHSLPCNILMAVHMIDKYGKPKPKPGMSQSEIDALAYAPNEVIGEKPSLRDQVGAAFLGSFSNVFVFYRELTPDNKLKFEVEFSSALAGNAFGIPPGRFDITGKNFYQFLMDLIAKQKEGKLEPPSDSGPLSII